MLRDLLNNEAEIRSAPVEPPPETLKKITLFINRMDRPFYLGQLANEIGWSLERAERFAEHLVGTGVLRRVSISEISPGSNIKSCVAYCVVFASAAAAHSI